MSVTEPNPHDAGAARRRHRRTIVHGASVALAALAWAACGASYVVEWSAFTKGPERLRTTPTGVVATGPTGAIAMPVERDETHLMFGHGLFALYSSTVYTSSFQLPYSDLNSRVLAWATVDSMFPGLCRADRYPCGPVMGVKTWPVACIATLPLVVVLAAHRRFVPPGHCRKCRYDLRGLNGETCPECGLAASAAN